MTSWMFYAVFGMLQSGLLMALFKVPAVKQINKYSLSAWAYLFAMLIAGYVLRGFIVFDIRAIIFAFVWGTSFAILSITQMHVLHKHDTSGVFPFTSLASNVFVVIGGVFFLHNSISLLQWVAILLSFFYSLEHTGEVRRVSLLRYCPRLCSLHYFLHLISLYKMQGQIK